MIMDVTTKELDSRKKGKEEKEREVDSSHHCTTSEVSRSPTYTVSTGTTLPLRDVGVTSSYL